MPLFKSRSHSSRDDNLEYSNGKRSSFSNSDRRSFGKSPRNGNGSRRNYSGSEGDSDSERRSRTRSGNRNGGFFGLGRNHRDSDILNDPTIVEARQKVSDAENAEYEADQALTQARSMVKEAKKHVQVLEREALEEAHRAKMKQAEARIVGKSARGLGRHG